VTKNFEQVFIVNKIKDFKVTLSLRIMTTMQSCRGVEKIQQAFFTLVLNSGLLSGLGFG
jgi:hypothetical protein